MWRVKRNIINKSVALGTKKYKYKSNGKAKYKLLYVFFCEEPTCNTKIEVSSGHIPYSTGRCKKHANLGQPYRTSYNSLVRRAKERKLKCSLTYEQYLTFVENPCYYCGDKISWMKYNKHGVKTPPYFIDRKNSKIGYTYSNCVACCSDCNYMKRCMSVSSFILKCEKIAGLHDTGGSCGV